ncbi:MAG: 2-C-methyl-D-erythritol 2,4-cyclodiphosphate synthase, partial [Gemmatimonadota bacterium]
MPTRTGIGYDSHRFAPGGPMRLGGVDVPAEMHLAGHSDGDAICHALTDAVLGAAGLGDIGEKFPDTAPATKGKAAGVLLRAAVERVPAAGFRLVNVDVTVIAERPKIGPQRPAIRARLAEVLGLVAGGGSGQGPSPDGGGVGGGGEGGGVGGPA